MADIRRQSSLDFWNDIHTQHEHSDIKVDDWLERFDDIISKAQLPILDLGCGSGNDTLYLISKGKQVIACDQSPKAIENVKLRIPLVKETKCFNMLDGLPFDDKSFEIVIADLCLHYFTKADTERIIGDIYRILIPGGHLILRVNSVNDTNHGAGQGTMIEDHVFEMENKMIKRFFDEADIRYFFRDFVIEFMNEEIMTRYSEDKRLYRVCVRKGSG